MFWIGILSGILSALAFFLVERRVGFAQKLHLRIKEVKHPISKALIFLVMATGIGVVSGVLGRIVFQISGDEFLQQIASWAVLGAGFAFLFSDASQLPQDTPPKEAPPQDGDTTSQDK